MKWYADKNTRGVFRACGWVKGKNMALSRFIMKPKAHLQVDHINGDSLDNRRSNLRVCTRSENNRNKKKISTNTSGFKGVSYRRDRKLWCAFIGLYKNGKRTAKNLGYSPTKEGAYKKYCEACIKYHGEFANLG